MKSATLSWVRRSEAVSLLAFFTRCCNFGTSQPSSAPSAMSMARQAGHLCVITSSVIGTVCQVLCEGIGHRQLHVVDGHLGEGTGVVGDHPEVDVAGLGRGR